MITTTHTNGTAHGASSTDEAIDSLYSWMPGPSPVPQPCPEATFSLTLKGFLDGVEALLTARGQTADEFKRNLAAIRGLLDPRPQPASTPTAPGAGWCSTHGLQMTQTTKDGRAWWSHRQDGQWCKGR